MSEIQAYVKEYLINTRKFNKPTTETMFYADIKTKEDIESLYSDAVNVLNRLSKSYNLHNDDMLDLSNAITMYETGVRKAMKMMERSFTQWDYDLAELKQLAGQLVELINDYKEINTRRLNQD